MPPIGWTWVGGDPIPTVDTCSLLKALKTLTNVLLVTHSNNQAVHLQYVSMGIYHHEFDMLKNPEEMQNSLAR